MKSKVNMKMLAGAIVGFLVVSAATFALLSVFAPRDTHNNTTTTSTVPTPKEVIEGIRKPDTIAELSSLYSESSTAATSMSDINYTKTNSYMINEPATDFIQYEQKDAQKSGNSQPVVDGLESYLKQKGLSKVEANSDALLIYTVFDSDITTCQLVSLPKMNTKPASITVACVKKEAITKTYDTTDKLLALHAKASSTTLTPTTIRSISVSEGNKTLTTLNVYISQDSATSLLFAAIGDSWEYLGERPLSTGTTENNPVGISRALSSELKAKIADPKYENFLKKNII